MTQKSIYQRSEVEEYFQFSSVFSGSFEHAAVAADSSICSSLGAEILILVLKDFQIRSAKQLNSVKLWEPFYCHLVVMR